jgi:hypothetical protein
MGVDVILKHQNKPYRISEFYTEYISTVLLQYIEEFRSNDEFANREALSFMANWSVHTRVETVHELADHGDKVITFPLHTTHVFESLDLSLLGGFQKKMNSRRLLDGVITAAAFIKCIVHNLKQTLVEDNVQDAFMQLGLSYDTTAIAYLLIFDANVLR